MGWMGDKENEQIKCKTKSHNQPKGHQLINKWIQVNRNQIYSNLFTRCNCVYQDFDMAAGADTIHSQKGARLQSLRCVCVFVCVCARSSDLSDLPSTCFTSFLLRDTNIRA